MTNAERQAIETLAKWGREAMTTKFFHSRRAAEREALKREQSSRKSFYFASTDHNGSHVIKQFDGNMNYQGNV